MVKVLYDCQTPFGEGVVQTSAGGHGQRVHREFQSPRGEGVVQTMVKKNFIDVIQSFNHLAVRGWFRPWIQSVPTSIGAFVSITSR